MEGAAAAVHAACTRVCLSAVNPVLLAISPGFSSLSIVWKAQAGCPPSKAKSNTTRGGGRASSPCCGVLGLIKTQSELLRPGPSFCLSFSYFPLVLPLG